MNNINLYNDQIFENIKHVDEFGNEYCEARELQQVLDYQINSIFFLILMMKYVIFIWTSKI